MMMESWRPCHSHVAQELYGVKRKRSASCQTMTKRNNVIFRVPVNNKVEILLVQTTVITAISQNRLLQAAVNQAINRDPPLRTISQAVSQIKDHPQIKDPQITRAPPLIKDPRITRAQHRIKDHLQIKDHPQIKVHHPVRVQLRIKDPPLQTIRRVISKNHQHLAAINLPATNKAHRRLAPAINLPINHLTLPEVTTPQVPQRHQNLRIPMENVNTLKLIYLTKQTALVSTAV